MEFKIPHFIFYYYISNIFIISTPPQKNTKTT